MKYTFTCSYCGEDINNMGSLKRPGKDGRWCSVECLINSAKEEKKLNRVKYGK